MKTEVILWGTGKIASQVETFIDYEKTKIIAYVDNNEKIWGLKRKCPKNENTLIPIIKPDMLYNYVKDEKVIIIIASSYYTEILEQLENRQIHKSKIINGCYSPAGGYDKRLEDLMLPNYFEKENSYEIEGFKLKLGGQSQRALYGREHLMYDAFIPYLGRLEEKIAEKRRNNNHWIIDIGANVGDTALGMIKNTSANIIAVEPTKIFYQLLNENIRHIDSQYSKRISTVQAYISNDENEKFQSQIANGTAVKQLCEIAEAPTISVKNLLKKKGINPSDVNLIKVDTDGWDSDCIMSCDEMLKEYAPLLYWENQIDGNLQYKKYMKCCDYLLECKYCSYFIFDNFGNYIGCVDNDALKDINGYLARINNFWGTRTFYYIDVLACKKEEKDIVQKMIGQYLNEYPIERFVQGL